MQSWAFSQVFSENVRVFQSYNDNASDFAGYLPGVVIFQMDHWRSEILHTVTHEEVDSPMQHRKRLIALFATAALVSLSLPALAEPSVDPSTSTDPILWYRQPASQTRMVDGDHRNTDKEWQQTTLPIGNGDLGGTIYGEIGRERLVINEKTLWTGGPGSDPNYAWGNDAAKGRNGQTLREVQRLFEEGNKDQAARLASSKLVGIHTRTSRAIQQGAYQAWGELFIDQGFENNSAENYRRDLNLKTGVASVSFIHDGASYTREMFVSHPHNVLVVKLHTDRAEGLKLDVSFPTSGDPRRNKETITFDGNVMTTKGSLHNNGLKYNSKVAVDAQGTVQHDGDSFQITGGSDATIYLSAATDFAYEYPSYRNGQDEADLDAEVAKNVNDAVAAGYEAVRDAHVTDHSALMGRVDLNLGGWDNSVPTDELLAQYNAGGASPAQERTLETLLYQYGRYMTVGSSRADSQLPANLQGVWQRRNSDTGPEADWKSDYHLNVNLQMNYWPTYSSNLGELADPMIRYIEGLVGPGRETAKVYFGTDGSEGSGFSAHTETTPYGWTAPGHNFSWGWSPAGVPWMLQNVYDAYEYSLDTNLLETRIYPLMKEQTTFYIDKILHPTQDAYGEDRLASSPAYSPEHGPVSDGNVYEQMLIWQLLNDTIHSASVLNVDENLVGNTQDCSVENWRRDWAAAGAFVTASANRSWACALSLLKPVKVGDSGQIKEWYDEGALGKWRNGGNIPSYQTAHRHMSHLLGLFPGDLITVDNPQFMDAAKYSLNRRTDTATGWGIAQRLNSWARTGDGNRTHLIIRSLFRNGIYPNLFDTHPPFQIDGNFGYTSAVNELLLQSNSTYTEANGTKHENYMNVLAALPSAWATGHVSGLRARGNFTVDMDWANGSMETLTIHSGSGVPATVAMGGARGVQIVDSKGQTVEATIHDGSHFTFPTTAGETYTVTGVTSMTLASLTGATVIGTADGFVQLVPSLKNGAASDESPRYTWTSSAPEIIQVDENGRATAQGVDGTATITVALTDDPSVKASIDLTVYQGETAQVNVDDNDPKIVYSSRWGTWNQDARNFGNTLHWVDAPNQSIEYTFTGIGLTVYGNLNRPLGIYKICIDGEENCQTVRLDTANDQHQQALATFTGLENTEHVVRLTNIPGNGKNKVELDYFSVHVPGADRNAMQAALQAATDAFPNPDAMTPESVEAFKIALEAAAAADNNLESTTEELNAKAEALTQAIAGLTRDEEAPTAPANLNVDAAETELTVTWEASTDNVAVDHYIVTVGDQTRELTEMTATFDGLTAGTEYAVRVVAVDKAHNESNPATTSATTKAQVVEEPPAVVPPEPPVVALTVEIHTEKVTAGEELNLTVRGLKPMGDVVVELHSVVQTLATGTANETGELAVTSVISPETEPGDHNIVVKDLGNEREASFPVTVAARAAEEPTPGEGAAQPSEPADGGATAPSAGTENEDPKPGTDDGAQSAAAVDGSQKPVEDARGETAQSDTVLQSAPSTVLKQAPANSTTGKTAVALAVTGATVTGVLALSVFLGSAGAGAGMLRRRQTK